jgi:hypothetical protein
MVMAKGGLSAERMLSLPRPRPALPSPDGRRYAIASSSYDFEHQRTSRSFYIDSSDESAVTLSRDPLVTELSSLELVWLDADTLLYLRPRGSTKEKGDVDATLSDAAHKKTAADDEPGVELWALKADTGGDKGVKLVSLPVECAPTRRI